ncbi:hypothetical protein [Nocardia sp. NBC_01327]|uniref:hypothetical protein n=1 Tax=Nocardia sp. NBC_01327 TaxID=2903593 RepID=UPI002E14707E|nr:hypothetical protein OG326_33175 [Nocardia sp. NBC_01327]
MAVPNCVSSKCAQRGELVTMMRSIRRRDDGAQVQDAHPQAFPYDLPWITVGNYMNHPKLAPRRFLAG